MKIQKLFLPGEITERANCCDRIEPLRRHPANPVLVADRPWESHIGYPCVLHSATPPRFRMWYEAGKAMASRLDPTAPLVDGVAAQYESYLCYAESDDGLRWTKPALDLVRAREYGPNNILAVDSGRLGGQATVIEDDTDPDPARRFKLLIYDNGGEGRDGARTATSPDGIHWTFADAFPVLPSQDTPSLWHDRRRGRYVAFLKNRLAGKRARLISVSHDFINWSEAQVLLAPDPGDSPTLEFYSQQAFHHWGHDLGLLCRFDVSTQRTDLELIAAPDGIGWRRLPTRPQILPPGELGSYDGGGIYTGNGDPIEIAGECRVFYCGSNRRHSGEDAGKANAGGFCIATFTPGRLAGQQFTGAGWFQSLPFRCPGGRLALNAVARKPVTVEVWSIGYGWKLDGYTSDQCRPISGDSLAHAVTWNDNTTLDPLKDRFIQLRVHGSLGTVFGITFES